MDEILKNCYHNQVVGKHIFDLPNTNFISEYIIKSNEQWEEEGYKHELLLIFSNKEFNVYDDTTYGGYIVVNMFGIILASLETNLYNANNTHKEEEFILNDKKYKLTWNGVFEVKEICNFENC